MTNTSVIQSNKGNAAKRKRQLLLANAMKHTTQNYLLKVGLQKGMSSLNFNCGLGNQSWTIKELVGNNGKVLGIDSDRGNIRIAQESARQIRFSKNIRFKHSTHNGFDKNAYDFVYCNLDRNQWKNQEDILNQWYGSLKVGGFAVLEEISMSQFHWFPNCYAFDRFLELYNKWISDNSAPPLGIQWKEKFQQAGFKKVQVQLVSPSFLSQQNKSIASLTLESIAPELIDKKMVTDAELNALLFELKDFEEQPNTLISLPGIYQVVGYK